MFCCVRRTILIKSAIFGETWPINLLMEESCFFHELKDYLRWQLKKHPLPVRMFFLILCGFVVYTAMRFMLSHT